MNKVIYVLAAVVGFASFSYANAGSNPILTAEVQVNGKVKTYLLNKDGNDTCDITAGGDSGSFDSNHGTQMKIKLKNHDDRQLDTAVTFMGLDVNFFDLNPGETREMTFTVSSSHEGINALVSSSRNRFNRRDGEMENGSRCVLR
jgi:hypothetical protein